MRAPDPQGCFLTEILMDELADRVRMDPVKFRIRICRRRRRARKWGDYFERPPRRSAGTSATPPAIRRPGRSRPASAAPRISGAAAARRPRAHRHHVRRQRRDEGRTQDLGTGTRTMVAMLTAETLGLPVGAVTPEIGDTNYPVCSASGGSTTAASISPAIRIAAGLARDAVFAKARRSSARRRQPRRRNGPSTSRARARA
jgi:xanthine dehydrogenase YagR molybdenum-binding subunit